MKIGIAGVSSVGKSTLTKAVAEALNFPAILDTDVHAAAFARMDSLGQTPHTKFFPDMTREEHINFERAYLVVRIEKENGLLDFVGDETPLDILNYFYHVCAPHPEIMSSDEFIAAADLLWKQVQTYDVIWYIAPGQIPIVDDGRRFTNVHLLTGWDHTLRGLIGIAVDLDKPILGFLMNVPELDKRVKVVTDSVAVLRQMDEQRKQMN